MQRNNAKLGSRENCASEEIKCTIFFIILQVTTLIDNCHSRGKPIVPAFTLLWQLPINVVTWRIIKKWCIWSLHLHNFLCFPVLRYFSARNYFDFIYIYIYLKLKLGMPKYTELSPQQLIPPQNVSKLEFTQIRPILRQHGHHYSYLMLFPLAWQREKLTHTSKQI